MATTGYAPPTGAIPRAVGEAVPTNDPPVAGAITVVSITPNADGSRTYAYSDGSSFHANPDGKDGVVTDAKGDTKPAGGGYLVSRTVDPDGTIVSTMSDGTIDRTNPGTGHVVDTDPTGKVTNSTYRPDSGVHPGSGFVDNLNNFLEMGPTGLITKAGDKLAGTWVGQGANGILNKITDGNAGVNQGDVTDGGGGAGSLDTAGVQKDIDAAKALRDQFDAAYRAAHPGEAPKINPTLLGPQTLATAAGPATSVGGTAGHADASLAAASLLDPTQQAQFRTQQQGLADYLNTVIAGKTPSVAQLQMLDALQKNEANQLGIASKGSGGGNAFLALQNAANQIGRLNQGASSDAAVLRAKEEADARGELANVLSQGRTSDITMADRNATLQTGVNTTNATNKTSTNNANAGRDTDVSLAKAAADNAAALQHERELNSISTTNAGNATNLNINQGTIASGEKKADASNILTQQEQDEKAKQDAAANAINSSGQAITGGGNLVDSIAKIQAAKAAAKNNTLGQVGSAIGWAFS